MGIQQICKFVSVTAAKYQPAAADRPLPPGDRPYDEQRLRSRRDSVRQRSVRRLMRKVLRASEESQERTALLRNVIPNCSAQHRIAGLQRVKDRALRDRARDLQLHVAANLRQRPQVGREYDSNHGSVWTSTESTAGRSRTMGAQLSPASAEAYTWPPVVPK